MSSFFKYLAVGLALVSAVFGAPNDIVLSQVNTAGTKFVERRVAPAANAIFGFDGAMIPTVKLIGTDIQAYDPDLLYLAGFTPSANVKSFLNAADFATLKGLLSINNIDNTSDFNKPVSTAQAAALNLKASLAGTNTFTGVQTYDAASVATPNTLAAFVIDTEKGDNRKTISASQAFTFSNDTPTTGKIFPFTVTNSGVSTATVTLTSATPIFSKNNGALITTFTVAAGGTEELGFIKESSRFFVSGVPTTINDLTADLTPSDLDLVQTYDVSAGNGKKVRLTDILALVNPSISDAAYDATDWNGSTTNAPSKNAVRDAFEALTEPIPLSYLSIDGTLASDSDDEVPSVQAVKTYVDTYGGGAGLSVGSYFVWDTAKLGSKPANTLLADGTNGTINFGTISSGTGTWIVQGAGTVANVTFSPVAGSYAVTQNVTPSTVTSGASIRYTVDGSTPTRSTGTLYVATPISVAATTTIKAIAYKDFSVDAAVQSSLYTIGTAWLLSEDFEGTGTAAGWTNTGSPNWDYTTSPIVGSQSLNLPASSSAIYTANITASGTVSLFVRMRKDTQETFGNVPEIALLDSSGVEQARFSSRTDTTQRVYHGSQFGGGAGLANATNLAIWMDYVKGTGANGTLTVYVQTNGTETKPGSPYSTTTVGTSTGDISRIKFSTGSGGSKTYDKLRVLGSTIGSDPL